MSKKIFSNLLAIGFLILMLLPNFSCEKREFDIKSKIVTDNILHVLPDYYVIVGNIIEDNGKIKNYGHIWSDKLDPNFPTGKTTFNNLPADGKFYSQVYGLFYSKYYVWTYYKDESKIVYGDTVSMFDSDQYESTTSEIEFNGLYNGVATFNDTEFFIFGQGANGGNASFSWLKKINSDGSEVWTKEYSSQYENLLINELLKTKNGYIAVGKCDWRISTKRDSKGWIITLDSNGNITNQYYLAEDNVDIELKTILKLENGDYITIVQKYIDNSTTWPYYNVQTWAYTVSEKGVVLGKKNLEMDFEIWIQTNNATKEIVLAKKPTTELTQKIDLIKVDGEMNKEVVCSYESEGGIIINGIFKSRLEGIIVSSTLSNDGTMIFNRFNTSWEKNLEINYTSQNDYFGSINSIYELTETDLLLGGKKLRKIGINGDVGWESFLTGNAPNASQINSIIKIGENMFLFSLNDKVIVLKSDYIF